MIYLRKVFLILIFLYIFCSYLRADVFTLVSKENLIIDSIGNLIAEIENTGFDGVVIEVFADGLALYPSEIFDSHYQYDVLDELIYYARRSNLEVFIKLDVLLLWSNELLPTNSNHIFYIHREWFCVNERGENVTEFLMTELIVDSVNGYYISPSSTEYLILFSYLIQELLDNYQIDGIVFCEASIPGKYWAYDDHMRSEFVRRFYFDPLSEELGFTEKKIWDKFYIDICVEFLHKIFILIPDDVKIIFYDRHLQLYENLEKIELVDIFVEDSLWVDILDFTPKDLSDYIRDKRNKFILLDDIRNILRVIGYKEMLKLIMRSDSRLH